MKAADLEALAQRVEREESSVDLDIAVLDALTGTEYEPPYYQPFTSSLDAAASLMPPGWYVSGLEDAYDDSWVSCLLCKKSTGMSAQGTAPTEPRARTAAALRAMAMEARDE